METTDSCETLETIYQAIRYVPEDHNLNILRREKFRSHESRLCVLCVCGGGDSLYKPYVVLMYCIYKIIIITCILLPRSILYCVYCYVNDKFYIHFDGSLEC